MTQDPTQKLETWWADLSPEERDGLVQLEEGEPVAAARDSLSSAN